VESEVGKGSAFHLELRLGVCPEESQGKKESGGRGIAAVTLSDQRLLAHVRSVLRSLNYEVQFGKPTDADLWVTEALDQEGAEEACTFVATRPRSRALVFSGAAAGPGSSDRVIYLEPAIRPSSLQARIGQALGLAPTRGGG
jgi:hypothetical protein